MPEEMNSYHEMIIDAAGPNFISHEKTNHEVPPHLVAKKCFDILKEVERPLVEDDDRHSVLYACTELLYIKSENQLTQKSDDNVLSLVHDFFLSEELDIAVESYFEEVKNDEIKIEWDSDEDSDEETDEDFDASTDNNSNEDFDR
ncbi:hypothetical protein M9H77_36005 [Catharanthus roseus]|uniref:Uncharacterized protein n=1 Tax=Catharanthus roseus TaxID=4058 RepID=A0ACB9ZQX0_CATRO|nr:hypothetical protein M9H77_36005 [Catharanthus roseus]